MNKTDPEPTTTISILSCQMCDEHSLLHSQEAEQRLIGLLVESEDVLPVLHLLLLHMQPVQSEEGRVETREQQWEDQGGAAHHHPTPGGGGERRRLRRHLNL